MPEERIRIVTLATLYRGGGALPYPVGTDLSLPKAEAEALIAEDHACTVEDWEKRQAEAEVEADAQAKPATHETAPAVAEHDHAH